MSQSQAITGTCRAILAAACVMGLGVGSAWALPVTTWSFTSSAEFDTSKTAFTSGTADTTNTAHNIAWGTPYGPENPQKKQSSLVIAPSAGSGSVKTYEGSGTVPGPYISNPGITLTHNNFSVAQADGHWLTHAQLDTTITLAAPDYYGSPILLNLGIDFKETPNQTGSCPISPSGGAIPCPDIFVLSEDSLNTSFFLDDPDGEQEQREYFLSLFPATDGAVGLLPDAACAAAGAGSGCFGFITQENASNPLTFGLTITTKPFQISVPEPGVLGLMGLGLLLMAGVMSRQHKRPLG